MAAIEADKRSAAENPLVKAILSEFKGAKIDTITRKVSSSETSESNDENDDEDATLTINYDEDE